MSASKGQTSLFEGYVDQKNVDAQVVKGVKDDIEVEEIKLEVQVDQLEELKGGQVEEEGKLPEVRPKAESAPAKSYR